MRPGQLLALAVVLTLLLALLRPPLQAFEHPGWADELTAAYLGGVLWLRPGDGEVRMRLARQLLQLGRAAEAGRALGPRTDAAARRLGLEIDRAAGAEPQAILAGLRGLAAEPLGSKEVERLAALALGLGDPGLASQLYAGLGERTGEARFCARAAELALGASRPADAGRLFARAADGSDGPEARRLGQRAVEALIAAGAREEALGAARRLLQRFPRDAALLRLARDGALGIGRLDEALAHGRALAALAPGDRELRAWVARTAEWARRPAEALREWVALARRAPAAEFPLLAARAARLARGLGDHPALLAIHEEEARRGRLSADGLDGLLWACEQLGALGRAESLLTAYLDRQPLDEAAWRALGRLRQRLGDRAGARRAWSAVHGLSQDDEALLSEARLLIEDGQRDRARALLAAAPPRPALQALRGELAWEAGDDGDVVAAYRVLWRRGAATAVEAERLLRGLLRTGQEEELLAVARIELEGRRAAPVLGALEEALEREIGRGRASDAESPFDRLARLSRPLLEEAARFWVLLGRREQAAGRRTAARAAYEQALRRAPGMSAAREGLLWLLIEERDLPGLRDRLLAWQADAAEDRRLWRPFAVGHLLLGAPRESAAWFAREWPARSDDAAWLRGFAEALEGTGRRDAADRLRRLASRAGDPREQEHERERPPVALQPPPPDLLRVGLDSVNLGPLHVVQGLVALGRAVGPMGLELRAAPAYVTAYDVGLAELDLDLRAQLRYRLGRSELGLGGSLRTGGSLGRLLAAQQLDLRPLLLRAELGLDEVPADTAALRLGAGRHRLGILLRAELTRRLYGIISGDLRDHHDRTGAPLAQGYTLFAELGYRLMLARPALHLRLTGAWAHNRLQAGLPPYLAALLPPGAAPEDVLPARFAQAGAGLALGRPGGPGDRLRYLMELWLGWLWPQQSLGYSARFAVGLPLPGGGELSLGAYLMNNQISGLGGAAWGLGARYQMRLGRAPAAAAPEVPIL